MRLVVTLRQWRFSDPGCLVTWMPLARATVRDWFGSKKNGLNMFSMLFSSKIINSFEQICIILCKLFIKKRATVPWFLLATNTSFKRSAAWKVVFVFGVLEGGVFGGLQFFKSVCLRLIL